MLKVIYLDHERPGAGKITRFALELPWFSVWQDKNELELTLLRGQTEVICDMLVSQMGETIYKTYEQMLITSISEGAEKFERPTITD